jgi:hypothetical protein
LGVAGIQQPGSFLGDNLDRQEMNAAVLAGLDANDRLIFRSQGRAIGE